MSTDRFIAEHHAEWDELDRLTRRRGVRTGDDAEALLEGYQRVAAHLATVRTHHSDPALEFRLTRTVAAANATIYGSRERSARAIRRFFSETFPAAVWWNRRFILIAALVFMAPTILLGAWLGTSDRALEASAPDAVRTAYIENDFEAYYSSDPAGQFASEVFINNVQVAFLAFAVGILLALPTVYVLVLNGANLGIAAGLFVAAGRWQHFAGLITPHGLLEIAAIIVAGGAGLSLGWAIVAPGDVPRTTALVDAAQRSVAIVIGLIIAFAVAGGIEGFITGSGLSTVLRVGVGVVAFALFTLWIVAFGPPAVASGLTGKMGEPAPIVERPRSATRSRNATEARRGQRRPVAFRRK